MHALPLPESLDRKTAAEIAKNLDAHRGSDLILDAGAVRRVGAVGVGLLVATARQWQADGARLDILNWTEEACADLTALGADRAAFTVGQAA